MSENNGVVVVEVNGVPSVETPVQAPEAVVTFDFVAVGAAYPWFAKLPEAMQNAARDQWNEAAAEDATVMPTEGMDDQAQWEKALEAWAKERDTVMSEVDAERCEADYQATVKQLVKHTSSVAEGKQRVSVLVSHALTMRLAPNRTRKVVIKRRDAIHELYMKCHDTIDGVDEVTNYGRYGAAMRVLFGATVDKPIIGKDGICRPKATGDVKPMPWTTITALSPLVVKTGSDTEETWQVLAHVSEDVRTLVESVKADGLPRSTIMDNVAKLCHANATAEVTANPANKAAAKEAEKWAAKLPDADGETVEVEAAQGEAGTVEVAAVEAPAPTPATPGSLINPPQAPEGDELTSAAAIGQSMGEMLMGDDVDPIEALRSMFRTMLDDGGLDADQSKCVQAMMIHAARHASAKDAADAVEGTEAK